MCVRVQSHVCVHLVLHTDSDGCICRKSAVISTGPTSKFQASGGLKFVAEQLLAPCSLLVFIPRLGVSVDSALVVPLIDRALQCGRVTEVSPRKSVTGFSGGWQAENQTLLPGWALLEESHYIVANKNNTNKTSSISGKVGART